MNLRQHALLGTKFSIVGALGVPVGTVLLFILTSDLGVFYLLSSVIAFLFVNFFNWAGNLAIGVFSFTRTPLGFLRSFAVYSFSAVLALPVNLGVLYGLVHYLGVWYLLANIFGIGVGFLLKYGINLYGRNIRLQK